MKTEYRFGDFLFYTGLLAVPFLTAAVGIFARSKLWTLFYVLFSAGVAVVLLRFFCTRCPHYARKGALKCVFFWGLPKLFAPRAGGYDNIELAVTGLAAAAFCLFPLYWLLQAPGLLAVYLLSLCTFAAALYRNECERCIHLKCPMNRTEETGP